MGIKDSKNEAEVLIGNIKTKVKISELYNSEKDIEKPEKNIKIYICADIVKV